MSDTLQDLYQTIILDHNKRPRNYGKPDVYTHSAEGYNPLCGDRVEVFMVLKENQIEKICFESASCAICKASASMMTQKLQGTSLEKAGEVHRWVGELLSNDSNLKADISVNGDIAALAGVRKFTARIKCAVLPWQTYANALAEG